MKPTVVILPTYNEIESLPVTIAGIQRYAPEADILVVDDNSPDGTGELASTLAEANSNIYVLRGDGKNGLGAAYVAGFKWALDRNYYYIVQMDADGSHQPKYLPELLSEAETADLVIGSRWTQGGGTENWPMHRQAISRTGSWYARNMLRLPIRDVTGGFRVYRAPILRNIALDDIESQGYCFQIDLARRAYRNGAILRESPITFLERVAGESKMSGDIVKEAVQRVTQWGMQDRFSWLRRNYI